MNVITIIEKEMEVYDKIFAMMEGGAQDVEDLKNTFIILQSLYEQFYELGNELIKNDYDEEKMIAYKNIITTLKKQLIQIDEKKYIIEMQNYIQLLKKAFINNF